MYLNFIPLMKILLSLEDIFKLSKIVTWYKGQKWLVEEKQITRKQINSAKSSLVITGLTGVKANHPDTHRI